MRKTLMGLLSQKFHWWSLASIVLGLSTIKQISMEEGIVKKRCSLHRGQEWEETKTEMGHNNQTHPSKAALH